MDRRIIDLGDNLYSYASPDWSFVIQWKNDPRTEVAALSLEVTKNKSLLF